MEQTLWCKYLCHIKLCFCVYGPTTRSVVHESSGICVGDLRGPRGRFIDLDFQKNILGVGVLVFIDLDFHNIYLGVGLLVYVHMLIFQVSVITKFHLFILLLLLFTQI